MQDSNVRNVQYNLSFPKEYFEGIIFGNLIVLGGMYFMSDAFTSVGQGVFQVLSFCLLGLYTIAVALIVTSISFFYIRRYQKKGLLVEFKEDQVIFPSYLRFIQTWKMSNEALNYGEISQIELVSGQLNNMKCEKLIITHSKGINDQLSTIFIENKALYDIHKILKEKVSQ